MHRIINPLRSSIRPFALIFGLTLFAVSASARGQDSQSTADARVPTSVAREISRADEVVIREEGERTTHEYWVNGEMRLIRVVPATGPEYYLYAEDHTQVDGIDQSDALLVRWTLIEFRGNSE